MTAIVCCISMLAAAQNTTENIAAGKKGKVTVCVAKSDALAYEEPSTSSTHQEAYDLYEGNSLQMTSHDNNWYRYTDSDRESYYKKQVLNLQWFGDLVVASEAAVPVVVIVDNLFK